MGKNIFRTLCIICCVWCFLFSSVLASDTSFSGDDIGYSESSEGIEAGETSGDAGTDGTGEPATNGAGTILETPVEKEEQLTFAPAEQIVSGDATLTDVYNVLASIHNLIILFIFIVLILWAYKIITETYRRFLKNV